MSSHVSIIEVGKQEDRVLSDGNRPRNVDEKHTKRSPESNMSTVEQCNDTLFKIEQQTQPNGSFHDEPLLTEAYLKDKPRSSISLSSSQIIAGSTVSFHNINYTVNVRNSPCGKAVPKTILSDINGIFKPGMNAILGATGSGKSSLLDVLAGRKDPVGLQGDVLVDGQEQPTNFKCMSGYVVQDDVVMGTLSVRENFHFSAALRLPPSVGKKERNERVDNILSELGLAHCANSKVGTELIRGVSGGERKRTNIGMELIIQPTVLFLDEPTTGLDANTANSVMMILKRLALGGRNIIFSIHQPRFSIFRLFDDLLLLSKSRMVYHGPANEALGFFSSLGYECEEHNNPPDFFLDIINGDKIALAGTGKVLDDPNTFEESVADEMTEIENLAESLENGFKQSQWHTRLKNELLPIHEAYTSSVLAGLVKHSKPVPYITSFFTQFVQVSWRAGVNILRNPQTGVMQIFVMLLFGAIVGAIYWQVDLSAKSGIQNRVGAFFFIIMNLIFGNLSAVELFIKERTIFIHENSSGFYRVSAYFLGKVFCDTLPMRGFPVLVFGIITYWMIGFQTDVGKFFFYLLVLLLTALAASGLAFAVSASVSVFGIANLLIALSYVFMMVFSGLLVNIESIVVWLQWIKYFSIFRYALAALSINELENLKFYVAPTNATTSCEGTKAANYTLGTVYLDQQGIAYGTSWDLWQNVVALGSLTLIFLALSYIQLRRIKKLK